MIKILIVAYNFPPEGGPAVQRIAKFAKYFSIFGAEVFVLTARKKNKIIDETLLKDINDCKVTYTVDHGRKFRGELKKIFWRLFIPDKSTLWKYTAVKAGLKIIEKENIDIIFSTSPPHSTHLVAEKLVSKTGLKWIVDFRDEWVDNSLFKKSRLFEKQRLMEKSILDNCSHIITCTNTAKKNFATKIKSEKITLIHNGYDEEDFGNIECLNLKIINDKLIISYAGRLNELHSPKSFFRALSNLLNINKLNKERLSIEIIGNIENKKWMNKYPEINQIVNFVPYLRHDKLLEKLNSADVLLLLATSMNSTEFFPAKMFEYFRLNKRIFAIISSKGELWNTISKYGNSSLALDSDIKQIEESILNLVYNYEQNNFKGEIDNKFVESFDRKKLSRQLYDLCNNILEENK